MPNISKKEIRQAVHVLKACLPHPDAADAIAMLQGLLDQPEGEPVGHLSPSTGGATIFVGWDTMCKMPAGTKFYTHPASPITADDVTEEMLEVIEDEISMERNAWDLAHHKELIAAAVNAYLGAKK
jgi:hypothetical protein